MFIEQHLTRPYQEGSKVNTWLADIFDALVRHQDEVHVQEAGCRTLTRILETFPNVVDLIGEEDNKLPLHNSVLAAMNIHLRDAYVFEAACSAIHAMALSSKLVQKYLVARGAYVSIVNRMREALTDSDVQEWGCRALNALCWENVIQKEMLVAYATLDDLFGLLDHHQLSPLVVEEVVGLLACLASDLELVRRQCMLEQVHVKVLDVMTNFTDTVTLFEVAFELFALFAAGEERELLVQAGVLTRVKDLMTACAKVDTIQRKGCVLIQVLVDSSVATDKDLCHDLIKVIKEAANSFSGNSEILTEVVVALHVLAELGQETRELLVHHKIHECLLQILETHPSSQLSSLTSECLSVLSWEQSSNDDMLRSACRSGQYRIVDFLLKLGADPDSGPVDDTALCIACKIRDTALAELLLSAGASHLEKPLKLSLKAKNYTLAGNLLRRIGYDEKSGILAWSGLDLEELRDEYFFERPVLRSLDSPKINCNMMGHVEKIHAARERRRSNTTRPRCATVDSLETSPFEKSSSSSSCEDGPVITDDAGKQATDVAKEEPDVRTWRPRTRSGAILPFSRFDPRIVNSDIGSDRILPLQFGSPKMDQSYPGFPESQLSSELPSWRQSNVDLSDERTDFFSATLSRSVTEVLPIHDSTPPSPTETPDRSIELSQGDTSDKVRDTVSPPKSKRRSMYKFRSTGTLINHKDFSPTNGPIIKSIDLSCNSLTTLNVLSSQKEHMRHLVAHLEKLDASQNQITSLPKDMCANLVKLRQLYLHDNLLTEFPYKLLAHRRLEVLDLSCNRLCTAVLPKMEAVLFLSRLDLSYNYLADFPLWITDTLPGLTFLSLARNRLQQLPPQSLALRQLRELNLSKNRIRSLPDKFLCDCPLLRRLDLSHNELSSLPNVSNLSLTYLQTVNLSHNILAEKEPCYVPPFVLSLPYLKSVDLSHNKLTQIPPPTAWSSGRIEELKFDHNMIKKINLGNDVTQWANVGRLTLSYNKIEEIPASIGHLSALRCFDVSYNSKISKVPDEFGRLKNLSEFPVAGLKLNIDPSINKSNPRELVSFLHFKLKLAVPYHRMKLMFVGQGGRGKSTLLRQLQCIKHPDRNVATVGVEVRDWIFRQPKKNGGKNDCKKSPTFVINTWDFAGQEDFYSTHQCFLSQRALYIAVFNTRLGSKELELLRPWLLNIQAGAPGAPVIIVGTHADLVSNDKSKDHLRKLHNRVKEFIRSPGFPDIRGYAFINCLRESQNMQLLRAKIYEEIVNFTYKGQEIVEQMVPKSYVQLEDLLRSERLARLQKGVPPILTRRTLFQLAMSKGIQLDQEELMHAMKFLHETGVILFFDDSRAGLNGLFFLDPQWLCQVMSRVVTVRQVNPYIDGDAILLNEDMKKLFSDTTFSDSFFDSYRRLLCKFEIILPLDDFRNLVPCRLPSMSPSEVDYLLERADVNTKTVCRRYVFPYIPLGFWSRAITRLMLFAGAVSSGICTKGKKTSREACWNGGFYKHWTDDAYFIVCVSRVKLNTVDIFVPASRQGYMLLGYTVDHLDTLLEEWYPGLSHESCLGDDQFRIKRLVPCKSCSNDNARHHFTLHECVLQSFESEMIRCPVEKKDVFLREIAPDVLLEDLGDGFVIKEDDIELQEKESCLLGGGSFGTVYKAKYGKQNVAVKVFESNHVSSMEQHRQLRQEVNILRRLRHPSLISMVGVCLRPRTLVMELAPMGDLKSVIESTKTLSRAIQHRIAYQVAHGLAFLHRNCIVYRDLKPSNILLFSLSTGVLINAKIADYGISQYATPLGLASCEGTLGYRAPELERGDTGYNTEVDIYSLGKTLYELVIRSSSKSHPFLRADPRETELNCRTFEPFKVFGCAPWPDMEDLIQHCLHVRPEKRPSAEEICTRLASADFLCLRLEVGVCKEQSIECMAVRKTSDVFQDNLEVWIASGDAEGPSQISWFDPTSRSKPSCQGTVVKEGRILCMVAANNDKVFLGTKQGYIIIFDALRHTQITTLPRLPDSVLCLQHLSILRGESLWAGLANGQIAVFSSDDMMKKESSPRICTLAAEDKAISCITTGKQGVYCGVGNEVVVINPKNMTPERRWHAGEAENSTVNNLVLGRHLWTSCRDCSVVSSWDIHRQTKVNTIDCYEILRGKNPEISRRDCRAISIFLQGRETLWIGTGEGNIILMDVKAKCTPIAIFSRHISGVRCFERCFAHVQDKPVSLVLSGGVGFKERGVSDKNGSRKEEGCVLVWESDLARQHTHLENDRKVREKSGMTIWQ